MLESKLVRNGIDPDSVTEEHDNKILLNGGDLSPNTTAVPVIESKGAIMARVSSATTDSSSKAHQSYLGDSSLGISFAKLMLTAVKFQQAEGKNAKNFFQPISVSSNLKETNQSPSLLPPRQHAERFLELYFAQSNSQLPVLHREQFLRKYFEPIYGSLSPNIKLANDYTSINVDELNQDIKEESTWFYRYSKLIELGSKDSDIQVPTEFHKPLFFINIVLAISSSIHHLEYPAQISEGFRVLALRHVELVYSSSDRLESLQGLLLIASYSIMRPAVPGVWYTLGSVLRVCVDLGLHTEKGVTSKDDPFTPFTTDMRRRLFWCAYSLDRQVCFYLGRPFGIPEETIDAKFPSELDDSLISEKNEMILDYGSKHAHLPSYKSVSIAMFKIRKLQLEVQQILYGNSELPRAYKNLQEWKMDINKRLNNWKISSPKTRKKMNCDFNLIFFNLNYNHTRLILHGLSPRTLKLSISDYLTVADSSKEVIKCYKTLLELKRINYTWVLVHNLFMAGTSYLYSIYHCPEVANQTTLELIKNYSSDCVLVLNSLMDRCDAASHCRDTFEILSAAVIRLKYESVYKVPGNNVAVSTDTPMEKLFSSEQANTVKTETTEEEFMDLKIPMSATNGGETPGYQQQYMNSLIDNNKNLGDPSMPTDEWVSNSYDLDRFFQELDSIGVFSPSESSRSNSNSVNENKNDFNDQSFQDDNNEAGNSSLVSETIPPQLTAQHLAAQQLSAPQFPQPTKSKGLVSTKEGQRIYNMIYQIPDEPIWEQFFNPT